MSRVRQLALSWKERADADARAARHYAPVGEVLAAIAQTRRNDAWELMQLLKEMEKENPSEEGIRRSAQTNDPLA